MPLAVYNTLTRRVEPFVPAQPPKVSVYACGPTVYSHVHIGNWFAFTFNDVLVRWLRESGYDVTFVMNITDIEDKIIRDSIAAGETREVFTARWADVFFDGIKHLDIAQADHYPRATDHVFGEHGHLGMVEMIQALLASGHAYLAEDGSIYYRVQSFETYGELAGIDPEQLRAGASGRIAADEYEKDAVADFALWKAHVPEDGENFWEPVFTIEGEERPVKGRPGWHIECSVMSSAILGDQIDVHTGGEDLVFPHHQNEIAQSEAATGRAPFVRYWMHNRHLLVDGQKMSKSKGNFYTIEDLIDHAGPSATRAFRLMSVRSHYRSQMDFSWAGLEAAHQTLKNLDTAYARIRAAAGDAPSSAFAAEPSAAFRTAMDDDLNTPEAVAAMQTLVNASNQRLSTGDFSAADAASALGFLDMADRVLGLSIGETQSVELTDEQRAWVEARATARADKDWAESDRLRDLLAEQGIAIKDAADGQEVSLL